MGFFSKKAPEKLTLTFTKGMYKINDSWYNDLHYNHLTDLIQYFINKQYKSVDILRYVSRFFAEVHDVEVITENINDVLFVDSDGVEVYGDDKLFMVSISISGPTVKEIQAAEYYENWRIFQMLKKLDILLYVSKNMDNCMEKMMSYRELWAAVKK
jgi:hypothetical protein